MDYVGELEQLMADLYPYRWPILAGVLIVFAAVIAFAYFRGWHIIIWRHKLVSGSIAVVVLAVTLPIGGYLVSPLFDRSFLEEESPLVVATDDISGPEDAAPGEGPDVATPTADGSTSEF